MHSGGQRFDPARLHQAFCQQKAMPGSRFAEAMRGRNHSSNRTHFPDVFRDICDVCSTQTTVCECALPSAIRCLAPAAFPSETHLTSYRELNIRIADLPCEGRSVDGSARVSFTKQFCPSQVQITVRTNPPHSRPSTNQEGRREMYDF